MAKPKSGGKFMTSGTYQAHTALVRAIRHNLKSPDSAQMRLQSGMVFIVLQLDDFLVPRERFDPNTVNLSGVCRVKCSHVTSCSFSLV